MRPGSGLLAAATVATAVGACDGGPFTPSQGLLEHPPITCGIFPADNPWNTDVSAFPVHPESDAFIARLALTWRMQFVANLPINVIDSQRDHVPFVQIAYDKYGGDPGPMPIPRDAVYHVKDSTKLVQEDNHLVLVDNADCRLYELWSVDGPNANGSWTVGSGSIFDLTSNALRPDHLPSSAASGLPVFAGLARADEARTGVIKHALSIPATLTQEGFIRPATAWQANAVYLWKLPLACASPTFGFNALCAEVNAGTFVYDDPNNAPMGLRLRLKASFDLTGFTGEAKILLQAAKTYGLIVGDGSGTAGMLRGEKVLDPSAWDWSTSINKQLAAVPATAFEVVSTGPILQ
jgi:hypothetical protein